jgi:hypothetical protein
MPSSGKAGSLTTKITTSLPPNAVLPPILLRNLKPFCAASLIAHWFRTGWASRNRESCRIPFSNASPRLVEAIPVAQSRSQETMVRRAVQRNEFPGSSRQADAFCLTLISEAAGLVLVAVAASILRIPGAVPSIIFLRFATVDQWMRLDASCQSSRHKVPRDALPL